MNGSYKRKVKVKSDKKEEVQNLLNQHNISNQNSGSVKSIVKKEKRKKSPKLHSLSTLQAKAHSIWKYSPSKVLSTVQTLYEKKLVTYPRTDTQYITENEFAYLSNNIETYQNIIGKLLRFLQVSQINDSWTVRRSKNILVSFPQKQLHPTV